MPAKQASIDDRRMIVVTQLVQICQTKLFGRKLAKISPDFFCVVKIN